MRVARILMMVAFAVMLMAFGVEDAQRIIDGQWQSRHLLMALSIDLKNNRAIYIDTVKRIEGSLVIDEIVGRILMVRIGNHRRNYPPLASGRFG